MTKDWRRFVRWTVGLLGLLLILAPQVDAKPTTAEQAQRVAANWLSLESRPLGAPLGLQIKGVQTFSDEAGNPLYHVVTLDPTGLIFISGDNLVEPILGFSSGSVYTPTLNNTLGALVGRDAARRVSQVRELQAQAPVQGQEAALSGRPEDASRKWARLDPQYRQEPGLAYGLLDISDKLVDPLVQSKWGQGDQVGAHLYNYYTPNNYDCGCSATSMAQLMRYHKWPTTGIGKLQKDFTVDGAPASGFTRGSDGNGGAYDWSDNVMVLNPLDGITDAQRQAIGALTYDAGISSKSAYTSGGTGAYVSDMVSALTGVFKYANAKRGFFAGENIPSYYLYNMVNANLDARFPVLLGIKGGTGAHASHILVCDGYGYNLGTMYHHLNIGEEGTGDAWYNLPYIDAPLTQWSIIDEVAYNIFTTQTGAIISGRVTDISGNPLAGATVTAVRADGGDIISLNTNAKGIYAFPGVRESTSYTITASLSGYTFSPQTVKTGSSWNGTIKCGNLWGVNFRSGLNLPWKPKYQLFNLATTGTSSRAFAINDQGQIVGAAKTAQGAFHATLWLVSDEGGKQVKAFDLGTYAGGNESEAHGLTDDGVAVGWSQKSGSNNKYPCYWNQTQTGDFLFTPGLTQTGQALGINASGQIVGFTFFPPLINPTPCFWQNHDAWPESLGAGWYSDHANRIDDWGHIVGSFNNRAARWDGGVLTDLDPNGTISEALSPGGKVVPYPVGYYTNASGNKVACMFQNWGNIQELGSLGGNQSTAYRVNNRGEIVGQATNSAGRGRAFIYDLRNGMVDLNTLVDEPDWILNTAYDINDKGEIVGWGYYKGVFDFAFVLRPISKPWIPTILGILMWD